MSATNVMTARWGPRCRGTAASTSSSRIAAADDHELREERPSSPRLPGIYRPASAAPDDGERAFDTARLHPFRNGLRPDTDQHDEATIGASRTRSRIVRSFNTRFSSEVTGPWNVR